MQEILKLLIGVAALALGIPLGSFLARYTKEELKSGQKWFKLLVIFGLLGGVAGLIIKNDALLFTGLFIAIITSRSLRKK